MDSKGDIVLSLDEILRDVATFLSLRDLGSLWKTSRGFHVMLTHPSFILQYIQQHTEEESGIKTLEQLVLSQSVEVKELCIDNRIAVRTESRSVPAHILNDIPRSTERIAYIQNLLLRHPGRLRVRLEGHCGIRVGGSFASMLAFSHAHTVVSKIREPTAIFPFQSVRALGLGNRVAKYCAVSSDYPTRAKFAQLAPREVGWVEVYFELDGWRCPPRPSYYDPVFGYR